MKRVPYADARRWRERGAAQLPTRTRAGPSRNRPKADRTRRRHHGPEALRHLQGAARHGARHRAAERPAPAARCLRRPLPAARPPAAPHLAAGGAGPRLRAGGFLRPDRARRRHAAARPARPRAGGPEPAEPFQPAGEGAAAARRRTRDPVRQARGRHRAPAVRAGGERGDPGDPAALQDLAGGAARLYRPERHARHRSRPGRAPRSACRRG